MPTGNHGEPSGLRLFRQTLVVMAGIGTALIAWRLTNVILLLFASGLAAMLFFQLTKFLQRLLGLPFAIALTLAVILPITGIILIGWMFGSLMATQFAQLFVRVPHAFEVADNWLRGSSLGREIIARYESFLPDGSRIVTFVQSLLANVGTAVTELIIVLVAGICLAAQPALYTGGMLKLAPPRARPRALSLWNSVVRALHAWLKGQAIGMLFVGVGTATGFWVVGLPAPLAIGLVAGLCEFVPYLGVIVVSIPAIILGFSISIETGIWTILVLVVVQQVQGNFVSPMAQQMMVRLPPALTIFSLIAAALLTGPLGVILAVPLTVVGLVLVREWVAARDRTAMAALPPPPPPAPASPPSPPSP